MVRTWTPNVDFNVDFNVDLLKDVDFNVDYEDFVDDKVWTNRKRNRGPGLDGCRRIFTRRRGG